ncbi:hypothetical protein HDU84_009884 [Entophlyctis sp. JEL0112]|nr:hypothetical protein HDU84_009884 [Entophlyctis sp. JEL0112]
MMVINGQTMFCRALTSTGAASASDAPMACVQFNASSGAVLSPTYLQGSLGKFANYAVRPITIQFPSLQSVAGFAEPGGSVPSSVFREGWYANVLWRVCGTYPDQYVAGGILGNEYQYSTFGLDQGVAGTRVMATVLGISDILFCRGVAMDSISDDPFMACVLFADGTGTVQNQYYLWQQLGRWSEYSKQTN